MFRSHNRKIRVRGTGLGYELFLIAENAQHIIDRADHASHRVTLLEVMELAHRAYYVADRHRATPEPHTRVYGLVWHRDTYYQVIAYTTERYHRRCVVESCHVLNDFNLTLWCERHPDLVSVSHAPRPRNPRS